VSQNPKNVNSRCWLLFYRTYISLISMTIKQPLLLHY